MAEILLRPARREDFPSIRALIYAVRINPMNLDWRHFLVAIDPGEALLGCGQVKVHGDGSRELASIAVQEQLRGRGVARALIESLLEREHRRPLYLMCRAHLEAFYSKFGFRAVVDPADLPPYFRRIRRIEYLFNAKAPPEARLLIMRLD